MAKAHLALGLGLSLVHLAAAQIPAGRTVNLALDSAKPFVYIAFDHAGPRQPVEQGEPDQGLWLRLVNNSALPIEVRANGTATDPDMTILPDTITRRMVPISMSSAVREKMPRGYSSTMGTLIMIEPGKSLVFSVPANHVSAAWFLQVPFNFSLSPVKEGVQPVCLAAFVWEDIPEPYRTCGGRQLEIPPPR
ncbi:MAG: hypothetical protein ACLQKA_05320 [Bryobacteraceae bacterium]